jgi:hypothetical protein
MNASDSKPREDCGKSEILSAMTGPNHGVVYDFALVLEAGFDQGGEHQ